MIERDIAESKLIPEKFGKSKMEKFQWDIFGVPMGYSWKYIFH